MSTPARKPRGWLDVAEVGSVWGIRFMVGLSRLFGRTFTRWFLNFVVLYYVLVQRTGRRASREYFTRLAPERKVSFGDVYAHFACFAEVALDRLLIAAGERAVFEVRSHGREHLDALVRSKRGAMLLGAHLGSFEAMRLGATLEGIPINMVVNFSNAQRMQSVFNQLDPSAQTRFIAVNDQPLELALRVRGCIERGELVAILADRIAPGMRTTRVRFLGAEAEFPSGPFILAASLRCPVYLTFGLYRGGARYDLFCEPFAERIELPRKNREQALIEVVQRYADRLESYVREAPDNWFNFYPFWRTS
ncbi:MAG: lipid A biosynthesis acyltransferase [Polyangiales bacterium]